MKIYVDMDGTIVAPDNADFSKRSWLLEGRELWINLRSLHPTLLSWGRIGDEFVRIKRQKEEWVAREIPGTPLIVLPDTSKAEVCKPGDILIDDSDKHRGEWERAGGEFVHHINLLRTLSAISALEIP